jgi:hypothetical protein
MGAKTRPQRAALDRPFADSQPVFPESPARLPEKMAIFLGESVLACREHEFGAIYAPGQRQAVQTAYPDERHSIGNGQIGGIKSLLQAGVVLRLGDAIRRNWVSRGFSRQAAGDEFCFREFRQGNENIDGRGPGAQQAMNGEHGSDRGAGRATIPVAGVRHARPGNRLPQTKFADFSCAQKRRRGT